MLRHPSPKIMTTCPRQMVEKVYLEPLNRQNNISEPKSRTQMELPFQNLFSILGASSMVSIKMWLSCGILPGDLASLSLPTVTNNPFAPTARSKISLNPPTLPSSDWTENSIISRSLSFRSLQLKVRQLSSLNVGN